MNRPVLNVMMAFRVQIVLHVPPLLASVKPAHKMELHVIHVEVDSISTQTLVQLVQLIYLIVQHAHKMELHVIAVKVDYT